MIMSKASRSISLEIDEWKWLEEKAKSMGKSISEVISEWVRKEMNEGDKAE